MNSLHSKLSSFSFLQSTNHPQPFLWFTPSSSLLSENDECIHKGLLITRSKKLITHENYYRLTLTHLLLYDSTHIKLALPLRNTHLELSLNLGFTLSEYNHCYTFYCLSPDSYNTWISKLRRVCVSLDFDANYYLKELIGKGSFSKVYLGVRYKDKEELAIKIIKKKKIIKSIESRKALIKEIEIMRKINHPRIVKLHEVYENDTSIFLVMEYLRGGELLQYMRSKGVLTEKNALVVIKSTLEALEYCHRLQIVHRDLKLENLILT